MKSIEAMLSVLQKLFEAQTGSLASLPVQVERAAAGFVGVVADVLSSGPSLNASLMFKMLSIFSVLISAGGELALKLCRNGSRFAPRLLVEASQNHDALTSYEIAGMVSGLSALDTDALGSGANSLMPLAVRSLAGFSHDAEGMGCASKLLQAVAASSLAPGRSSPLAFKGFREAALALARVVTVEVRMLLVGRQETTVVRLLWALAVLSGQGAPGAALRRSREVGRLLRVTIAALVRMRPVRLPCFERDTNTCLLSHVWLCMDSTTLCLPNSALCFS